ncbi:MAG: PBP1A family penicillin-binding protein [Candidatus Aminicenantes bacterium]|nr:PBP1A family penicillin-binding protein [Candidatus Aminicenantes bacterium]
MAFKRNLSIKIKKAKKSVSREAFEAAWIEKKKKPLWRRIVKVAFLFGLFSSACVLGCVFGTYMAVRQNLPLVSELEEWEPNIITYIYSDDGEVIMQYAVEKRIEVPYEEIPDIMKKAILATEDPRFFSHKGIDFFGILRAIRVDISNKLKGKTSRLHGGSTISQQLARELFLHRRQTIRRKLKEAILSLQIEKRYSKQEIFAMYCNQFNLGYSNGAYGVEAASQLYFGKNVSELSLEEAALITGIFRGPTRYDPYRNPKLSLQRRNHVLNRMVEEGSLTEVEANEAKAKPLNVLPLNREDPRFASYFSEEVRRYLKENYGDAAIYREGLKVYTTLDPTLQKYAEEAVRNGLRDLDKTQGWRDDKRNLIKEGLESLEDLENSSIRGWPPSSWLKPSLEEKEVIESVVLSVEEEEASVQVKDYVGKLTNEKISWTKTENLKDLIKEGDVIHVKIKEIDEEKKELLVSLDQEPILEGAFLAIEPLTGQIKAMVGGYSFKRSEWNNATQAMRQAGSAIKPILYAAALDTRLFTLASIINDEPTTFIDKWSGKPWSPPNYDGRYKGAVTVRKGLEESRNIVTAKLLDFISPQKGAEYCRKFGITSQVYPFLSLSLGAFELRLVELVSAFTTFPNKGIRIKPYFISRIEDKDGNILEESKIEAEEVISPQIAYMMTSLLQGVVQNPGGTGWRARRLKWPLGGKTGTTDDYADAWFIGFSPSLCAGVWVGHGARIPIGERQSGAVAAQPIWVDFFEKVIRDKKQEMEGKEEEFIVEEFEIPPNLSFVEIDRKTGLLANPFVCLFTINEVFLPGTEPKRYCTYEDHLMILDYYEIRRQEQR